MKKIGKALLLIGVILCFLCTSVFVTSESQNTFVKPEYLDEEITSIASYEENLYMLGNRGLWQWNSTMEKPLLLSGKF